MLLILRNLTSLYERPRTLQNRVIDRVFETAEIAKFSRRNWGNLGMSIGMTAKYSGLSESESQKLFPYLPEDKYCHHFTVLV